MSKYKKGDKFVIEIDKELGTNENGSIYKIKGFNALVFDDFGLDKLEKIERKSDDIRIGDIVVPIPGHYKEGVESTVLTIDENERVGVIHKGTTEYTTYKKESLKLVKHNAWLE